MKRSIFDQLVCDPEKVRRIIDLSPGFEKHRDFSLQIEFDGRNYENQEIIYNSLLIFLTHLTTNYVGLKQYYKQGKDKLMFCLPKKAFREHVNKYIKSYRNKDILKSLSSLGKKKVVTKPGVVVELFTVGAMEKFDDYWCLIIHQTTIPYLCSLPVSFVLVMERILPYLPLDLLSAKEIRDERAKAGLEISSILNIIADGQSGKDTIQDKQ